MELYVLIPNGAEWEDMRLYDNKETAIAMSLRYTNARIEIFEKKEGTLSYVPTYKYYKDGVLKDPKSN
jgi:hypothetical protein